MTGISAIPLSSTNGSTLTINDQDAHVKMSASAGYQAIGDTVRISSPDSTEQSHIYVYADIEVLGTPIAVGAQPPDHSRWIGLPQTLQTGRFQGLIMFQADPSDTEFKLVLEKPAAVEGELNIRALLSLPDGRACLPGMFSIKQVYRTPSGTYLVGWPEAFDAAMINTYYFPATFSPKTEFSGLVIEGSSADCIADFDWSPITAGAPHIELMVSDGQRETPDSRGELNKVLQKLLFETPKKPVKSNL